MFGHTENKFAERDQNWPTFSFRFLWYEMVAAEEEFEKSRGKSELARKKTNKQARYL